MRFLFVLFFVSTSVCAQQKVIVIDLEVKLISNESSFQGGTLRINGLNVVPDIYIPIDTSGNYTLSFPRAGKYELWFSDTVSKRQSFWMDPVEIKIRKKHNKSTTVYLQSRCNKNGQTARVDFEQHQALFYVYGGIAPSMYYPNIEFEKKYGVSFYMFGCRVDLLEECAYENNNVISQLMDEKYGIGWREELPYTIEGIETTK